MAVPKLSISRRLGGAGLQAQADAYREEIRRRLARERGGSSRDREAVNDESWREMWEVFKPLVERREKEKEKAAAKDSDGRTLVGLPDDVGPFLDPNYAEKDPGKWIRDGLLWTAAEIRRVLTDSGNETTVDLARAKTPPPTVWAVFCLESYAWKAPDKRGDLIARVLTFATRTRDPSDPPGNQDEDGGFLHELD